MKVRLLILLLLQLTFFNALSQSVTGFSGQDSLVDSRNLVPNDTQLDLYYDSLKAIYNKELLTGCVFSYYSEPIANTKISVVHGDNKAQTVETDAFGRFFFSYNAKGDNEKILMTVRSAEYHKFDTLLFGKSASKAHIHIQLTPKYKAVIRGRVITGSLPTENVNVTFIHRSDTFKLKTLGCYTDKENYWNCLYRGMFKQTVNFEDPNDSVSILLSMPGFNPLHYSILVSEYDGTILPFKLEYADKLPEFPKHNISLKITPPLSNIWSVGVNYTYLPQFMNFNRLGFGIEGQIHVTNHSVEVDPPASTSASFDTTISYNDVILTPNIYFWLTKPDCRKYSVYANIGFPYYIQSNQIRIQPLLGGRFYLDLNKAIIAEIRYASYKLEVDNFEYASGEIIQSQTEKEFSKVLINLGLQVSF